MSVKYNEAFSVNRDCAVRSGGGASTILIFVSIINGLMPLTSQQGAIS
jgi:hypothetical protein